MARPLRIQFPDAWYHVMNRGKRGEKVFKDKRDCYAVIDLLKDCVEMWNIRIAANQCYPIPLYFHLGWGGMGGDISTFDLFVLDEEHIGLFNQSLSSGN